MSNLDEQAVKSWLRGQRFAAERVEAERVCRLLALTPEESLQMYLELYPGGCWLGGIPGPSPVLMAMRRVLSRYTL